MTKEDIVGIRSFTQQEREAFTQRLDKMWANLQANDHFDDVRLPSLMQGFGDWRRISAPISESYGRVAYVLLHNGSSDEFALMWAPDTDEPIQRGHVDALHASTAQAVAGDFMSVWRWALSATPPLSEVAMEFAARLPTMGEDVQFLSSFTLVSETYRHAAQEARPRLMPLVGLTRAAVDLRFWEATDAGRERVTRWAHEEVDRFVRTLSDREVSTNEDGARVEVEHLVDAFIDEQVEFDPLGRTRVAFEWSAQGVPS